MRTKHGSEGGRRFQLRVNSKVNGHGVSEIIPRDMCRVAAIHVGADGGKRVK
ncbi:hypothetical protein OROMI_021078 [Orobanche minor]